MVSFDFRKIVVIADMDNATGPEAAHKCKTGCTGKKVLTNIISLSFGPKEKVFQSVTVGPSVNSFSLVCLPPCLSHCLSVCPSFPSLCVSNGRGPAGGVCSLRCTRL